MSNCIKEKKYAIILDDNRITDYIYDEVAETENTLYGLQNSNSSITAFDKENGNILFKISDVSEYEVYEGIWIIELNEHKSYVYFDEPKKIYGPFVDAKIYEEFYAVKVSRLIKDSKSNNYVKVFGLYNIAGKLLLPIKYTRISLDNVTCTIEVEHNGKLGLTNFYGDFVIEPIYDNLTYHWEGEIVKVYSASLGKYGAFDRSGDILFPCQYNSIEIDEKANLIYVLKDGVYGIYDLYAYEIFPPSFTKLIKCGEVLEVKFGDQWFGYIHKLNRLFPRSSFTYYEDKLKYFDGYKWRTLKYNKK